MVSSAAFPRGGHQQLSPKFLVGDEKPRFGQRPLIRIDPARRGDLIPSRQTFDGEAD